MNILRSRTLGYVAVATAATALLSVLGTDTARADDTAAPVKALETDQLGDIVVDSKGMTVYAFEGDTAGTSGCQSACLKNWPVVTAPEAVPASVPGIDGQFGLLVRPDGIRQLTLDSHPLYTFVQDTAAGQHNGVGKKLGDLRWGVMSADGEPGF